jgi:hypothetical protein
MPSETSASSQATRPSGLGDELAADHVRLEALFAEVENAYAADARCELLAAWTELEGSLTAHMALEERAILPRFAEAAPADAAALRLDHDAIRRDLAELGVCVELHSLCADVASRFLTHLRAHARREDGLFYRWATQHGDATSAEGGLGPSADRTERRLVTR